ncbi:MAG: Rrf2 family transcriptional regulator [Pseudomonadota bacterium]
MRLTTKGRYAVTAMLDLALHSTGADADARAADAGDGGRAVTLADISARQGISPPYLQKLCSRLRGAGLICAARGPGGGYKLAIPATDISVSRILAAVDEGVDATRCGGSGDCQHGDQCLTHELWSDLSNQIDDFLAGVTLADVIERRAVRQVSARQRRQHPVGAAGPVDARIDARNLH